MALCDPDDGAATGELDPAADRLRWQLAIDAAGIGGFDYDRTTRRLHLDDRLLAIFGLDRADYDDSVEMFASHVHPADRDRIAQGVRFALDTVGEYEVQYRVIRPSGEVRWLRARGRAQPGPDGRAARLLGAVIDLTDYRDDDSRTARILESTAAGFMSLDRDWHITYVNAEGERILGHPRQDLLGRIIWDVFPEAVGSDFDTAYRRAMRTGRTETLQGFSRPLQAWHEVRASPTVDGLALYFVDITAQHEVHELVQLSARVGERLAGSLEIDDAVRELARLVVPRLGDWSIVSIVGPDGRLEDVASWHVDPQLRSAVEQFAGARFFERDAQGPMGEAQHSLTPVIYATGVMERMYANLHSPVAIEAVERLRPESSAAFPLSANGRVNGILSICRGPQRPPFSIDETSVAIGIANRAGMALDNARLYAEQRANTERLAQANERLMQVAQHDRRVARALQDSLLTTLPEPDHLHLVARYLPASAGDQVGGDWYDAFILPTGATTLIIGDVVGHDISAAAVMGQLRNMLRALAWDRDEPPSQTIGRLDRAIRDLRLDTLATIALVSIEQGPADERAGLRTLRWTNAGHPPPLVVTTDGKVTVLERPTDVLLGVAPQRSRHDHTYQVPPESTLLLYTDGLIETRDQDLGFGLARLVDAVAEHHALEPNALLDAVISTMVGDQPEDDVAVLAVRFGAER